MQSHLHFPQVPHCCLRASCLLPNGLGCNLRLHEHAQQTAPSCPLHHNPRSRPHHSPIISPIFTTRCFARMASTAARSHIPQKDLESFQSHLNKSTRILALLGAGLSASSGLPTFRGAGGLWRTHDATELATPEAFGRDPGLVWQFYSYRRHMALQAKPNPAHYALAELAKKKDGFITLSQNVDGMLMTFSYVGIRRRRC